jgi:beta-glucosidase
MAAPWPDGFLWGVSTSAYQIEGATEADGRGPSIWDAWAKVPGRMRDGETGDPASGHYARWREDVARCSSWGRGPIASPSPGRGCNRWGGGR